MRVTWTTEVEVEGSAGEVLVITQGPDGEAHQDRPEADETSSLAAKYEEERLRYLNLAETVLEGLRAIFAVSTSEADLRPGEAPREAIIRETRMMAEAIGDGDLVGRMTEALARYAPGEEAAGYRFDTESERLARAILERQLERGEATVPWEDQRDSERERRVAVANTVLRTALLQFRTFRQVPGAEGWIEALRRALVALHGLSGATAGVIARHALAAYAQGRVSAPGEYVEAASAAEAS